MTRYWQFQAESEHVPEDAKDESAVVADAIDPVNKVMFHFNDKLYFWGI
jgi:phospholipid-binding lipoprotein MlaA